MGSIPKLFSLHTSPEGIWRLPTVISLPVSLFWIIMMFFPKSDLWRSKESLKTISSVISLYQAFREMWTWYVDCLFKGWMRTARQEAMYDKDCFKIEATEIIWEWTGQLHSLKDGKEDQLKILYINVNISVMNSAWKV